MGKKKNKKKNVKNNDKTKKYLVKQENSKKNKKEKKAKKKHPKLRLFIKIIFIACILVGLAGAGVAAGVLTGLFGGDFNLTEEELRVGELNSDIFDKDGNQIGTLNGKELRRWVALEDMSPYLQKAFVSIEDERFYSHHGVDVTRSISATVKYALSKIGIGDANYGGSSITQQLVKNLTKEDDRDAVRKIKEMARAYNLEKTLSKDQILELYLNLIFFGGSEIHGVELASIYYFNKSARDLDLAESAFLAGINTSPNAYIPFITGESDTEEKRAAREESGKTKAKIVLNKMKELGAIETEEEYNIALEKVNTSLAFDKGTIIQNVYSYHTDAAIEQIVAQIMEENPEWSKVRAEQYLFGGGFNIYTTQDSALQSTIQAESEKKEYIRASRKTEGVTSQVAMVIIDHKTGQVVATVGGTGEKNVSRGKNRALALGRKQTGSSMKPISVIAPALENGIITAGSAYDDSLTRFPGKNYGYPKDYYGQPKGLQTVRYAIEISGNIIPTRIMNEMGAKTAMEWLESAGVTSLSPEDEGLALALGGVHHGICALEMAGAYAAIANGGEYITPTFYLRVEDSNGNVVYEPKQEKRRVLSEQNAYVLKSILTQPVIGGTATACRISGMDVAAKTGTTDDDYDRWLCGFTPYYTAATWFGYDENETVYPVSPNPALTFWISVMRPIHSDLPSAKFEAPSNIVYAAICKKSGYLPGEYCGGETYTEVFVSGTVPGKRCDVHISIDFCDSTGLRANEYCPVKKTGIFITRPRTDSATNWSGSLDAKDMAPTETCTIHTKPPEPVKPPDPPKPPVVNNTVNNNTVTNNTVMNNTMTNNTTNSTTNNSTGKRTSSEEITKTIT